MSQNQPHSEIPIKNQLSLTGFYKAGTALSASSPNIISLLSINQQLPYSDQVPAQEPARAGV